ncbi:MAG: aminotransferase, partial [Pseudomonadota bacterium]|nr:aminotransferase [Pseudomonadota bacterium]
MTIDIEKIRADTPGIGNVAHFNNAGASLMPTPVLDAQIDHLKLEASIGGYEAAAAAAERCEAIYASV